MEQRRYPVRSRIPTALLLIVLGSGMTRASAQEHAGHALGTVDVPISCSEQAQVAFNRALALLHHMTYPQAREAFGQVAEIAELKRLQTTGPLQPTFKTAFHLASTRARYALERHAWDEARTLVPREPATLDWDRFMWPEAVTWFARGLGATHEGEIEEARQAGARLAALEAAAGQAGEELVTRTIRVLRLTLEAWFARFTGSCSG